MYRVRGRWILRRWVELGDSVRCRHVSRHTWRRVGCWLRDVRRGASLPDGVAHARGVRGGQLLHRRRVVHRLPSGSYQNAAKQSACMDCEQGSFCLARSSTPLSCSPGTFSASAGLSACVACPAGEYQSDSGESACDACDPGGWCGAGSSGVTPCDEGSYRGAVGGKSQNACSACKAGHACAKGATAVSECSSGSFAASEGLSVCIDCAAGEY